MGWNEMKAEIPNIQIILIFFKCSGIRKRIVSFDLPNTDTTGKEIYRIPALTLGNESGKQAE